MFFDRRLVSVCTGEPAFLEPMGNAGVASSLHQVKDERHTCFLFSSFFLVWGVEAIN
jgi:hypothetical protein